MKSLHRQQGAETVEFAIASTLIFILLFGIIEFSVALFDKATLTNASREGARTGILFRPGGEDRHYDNLAEDALIEAAVRNYAENYLISLGGVADMSIDIQRFEVLTSPTEVSDSIFEAGDEVQVTVNYPYQFLLLPGFIGTLGGVLDLSATTVMRAE